MTLDLTADLCQKIVVNATPDQRIAEPAVGGLVRHWGMQIEPAEQHEIEPHFQRPLQLVIAQPMPLANEQALEQHQRIKALRPDPGPPQSALQNGRKLSQVQKRVYLGENTLIANPIRRFTKKQVHKSAPDAPGTDYQTATKT